MASIEKRISKSGERTYHITVCAGYGLDGKKVRRRTTYKPDANMSDKQADKAAQKEAFRFELYFFVNGYHGGIADIFLPNAETNICHIRNRRHVFESDSKAILQFPTGQEVKF